MTQVQTDTLLLIVEFMGLGVAAFGVGFGCAWLMKIFDAAATLKD
jgi:hypothetical protein